MEHNNHLGNRTYVIEINYRDMELILPWLFLAEQETRTRQTYETTDALLRLFRNILEALSEHQFIWFFCIEININDMDLILPWLLHAIIHCRRRRTNETEDAILHLMYNIIVAILDNQ